MFDCTIHACWTEHWKIKLGMAQLGGKEFMSEDYILSLPVGWSTDSKHWTSSIQKIILYIVDSMLVHVQDHILVIPTHTTPSSPYSCGPYPTRCSLLQYLCVQRTSVIDKLDRPPLVYKTGAVNWGGQDWTVEMDWRRRRRTQCVEEEEDTVCGGGGGGGGHSVWRRRRRTQCVEEKEENTVCGGGGGHSVWRKRRRTQCVEEEEDTVCGGGGGHSV